LKASAIQPANPVFELIPTGQKAEKAMVGSCRFAAFAVALMLAACVDSGPPSDADISQDIGSSQWTRNQLAPVIPGDPPPVALDDPQRLVP
jgi:hypothetical protein